MALDTATTGQSEILSVSGLSTYFDISSGALGRIGARVHAVEDVSFTLAKGETLALVGESGCGKSTTGRTLIGLEQSTTGDIIFDGKNINKLSRQEQNSVRIRMQMIFQDPYSSLNPRMTVGDTISEPMRIHNIMPKEQIRDHVVGLLQKVGLQAEHFSRYPHEFSGGQRQRVSIARALGLNPQVIIADEAVSALDVTIKAQVINLFMDLQAELGLSLLFISHDIAVVERISHRVAVMYLGRIVEIGPRRAIFENPRHSYTKKLLSAVPVADPTAPRRDRKLMADEIPSALKPLSYVPEKIEYEDLGGGHFVAHE